jgi:hypothetical protein
MTVEEWRPVPGYPNYMASSAGRIVSHLGKRPYEMRGGFNQHGYRLVQLRNSDGKITRTVHRLIALAFFGDLPPGMQIRHLDGDHTNNAISNLRYGTASENILDEVSHGRHNMARKTHCPAGHPYDEVNTKVIPSRPNARYCRTCQRNWRAGKRAA